MLLALLDVIKQVAIKDIYLRVRNNRKACDNQR